MLMISKKGVLQCHAWPASHQWDAYGYHVRGDDGSGSTLSSMIQLFPTSVYLLPTSSTLHLLL